MKEEGRAAALPNHHELCQSSNLRPRRRWEQAVVIGIAKGPIVPRHFPLLAGDSDALAKHKR